MSMGIGHRSRAGWPGNDWSGLCEVVRAVVECALFPVATVMGSKAGHTRSRERVAT